MRGWGERTVEAESSFPLLEGGRSSARQADVKVEKLAVPSPLAART
ncbi:hypothetical protein [Streptomyces sp. 039-1]